MLFCFFLCVLSACPLVLSNPGVFYLRDMSSLITAWPRFGMAKQFFVPVCSVLVNPGQGRCWILFKSGSDRDQGILWERIFFFLSKPSYFSTLTLQSTLRLHRSHQPHRQIFKREIYSFFPFPTQSCGSVTFGTDSYPRSGSADPYLSITDLAPDPAIFVGDL